MGGPREIEALSNFRLIGRLISLHHSDAPQHVHLCELIWLRSVQVFSSDLTAAKRASLSNSPLTIESWSFEILLVGIHEWVQVEGGGYNFNVVIYRKSDLAISSVCGFIVLKEGVRWISRSLPTQRWGVSRQSVE